ncbi:hypothetical protein ACFLRT_01040 [Acidobacteriota bacterium]
MQLNFWVLKLRVSTLVKILGKAKGNIISGITYLEGTKPAVFLLRLMVKLKKVPAVIHKVQPRDSVAGPVLYLAFVRNDKDEVITLDIYHHILALRREIADKFFHIYKTFFFVRKQKYLTMLYANVSLRIAKDIAPAVYIAYYARWKGYDKNQEKRPGNVLFIPKSDWSHMVAANLEKVVDQVVIDKSNKRLSGKIQSLKHILYAFLKVGPFLAIKLMKKKGAAFLKELSFQPPLKLDKIMVPYAMGISKGQRSDLGYYHASDLRPEQLLVYVYSKGHIPSKAELDWIVKNKAHCVASPSAVKAPRPGMRRWESSSSLKLIKREFYGLYLNTVGQCMRQKNKHSWWLLDKLWEMGREMSYWKDFFIGNQIGIIVNLYPSENNFIPAAALSEIGGIAVECERSIRFDYCTFIHNMPHHVNFLAGPYSLTQTPEPAFSLFSILSSSINVHEEHHKIEELETVDPSKIILTLFDESSNDVYGGDASCHFYKAMIELIKQDERFFLLIKTKKLQILEELPDIYKEVTYFCKSGRCLLPDWRVTAAAASFHADLVVSIVSTAAFESVSAGTRTIVYNPMKAGARIFYTNNGLNRRIFEDTQTMIEAITRFADGDETIGDCSDIASKIDAFRDGQGARRIGDYLKWCIDALAAGTPREEVIQTANQRYAQLWGQDKIITENSFETQSAPKFYLDEKGLIDA